MNNYNKYIAYVLIISLFILGLFKDRITPDYHNSPVSVFLNPASNSYIGVGSSHIKYPLYWSLAYLYSISFVVIPYIIIRLLYDHKVALFTLYVLLAILFAEYIIVWVENPKLSLHILPKLNRYLHSPFITLFLIAALTLYKNADNKTS
jgi:peptidoglycan/LPS O-acetylase OafA/YrhL